MSFLMKKEFGIGNRVMKTITSFHNFEKDGVELEEPREDTASLPSSRTMSFEEGEISSEITHHFRIFKEIYEVTENIDNLTFFCLFSDCETIQFQVALDKKT